MIATLMATLSPDELALLQRDPWFSGLDAAFASELLGLAVRRVLGPGQHLFFRGDPPDGLHGVLDGMLRVSGVTEAGKEAVLSLLESGTWFGEISLFDRLPRAHHVMAEGSVTVLQVRQADMEAVLARKPRHWRDLGVLMALKTRLAFVNLEDLAMLPPDLRLARRLVWMAQKADPRREQPVCRLVVGQADLAATVCMSRQTANQVLMVLQAQGILRVLYGAIDVLDRDRLAEAARLSSVEQRVLGQLHGHLAAS